MKFLLDSLEPKYHFGGYYALSGETMAFEDAQFDRSRCLLIQRNIFLAVKEE